MDRKPRPSRFPPVLIVDGGSSMSYALTRAIEKIRLNTVVAHSMEAASRCLSVHRCHYLLICSHPADDIYIDLLADVARLPYRLPVVLLGEDDIDLRARVRTLAAKAGITLHCLPRPELAVIRILLADQRARDAGLPVSHVWGGVSSSSAYEHHIGDLKRLARERSRLQRPS